MKIQLLNKSVGSEDENNKDALISSRRDVANNALKTLNENIVHTPEEQCKVTVYVYTVIAWHNKEDIEFPSHFILSHKMLSRLFCFFLTQSID